MTKKDYPKTFYRYAFSGQAKCKECGNRIQEGQYVFEFKGNLYHGVCSIDLKDRKKLEEETRKDE